MEEFVTQGFAEEEACEQVGQDDECKIWSYPNFNSCMVVVAGKVAAQVYPTAVFVPWIEGHPKRILCVKTAFIMRLVQHVDQMTSYFVQTL